MDARISKFIRSHWNQIALYGALFAVLFGLLFWRLGSLPGGYSLSEGYIAHVASLLRNIHSLPTLLENPLGVPYVLVQRGLHVIVPDFLLGGRIVSASIGLIVLVMFAMLVRRWHGQRAAVVGTLLFGCSAWFLHIARLGTPDVLLFGVFALAACGYWLKQTGSTWALVACFVLATVLLYMPGMVWFIAVGLIWQWKIVDQAFKKHLIAVTTAGLAFLAALAPLGWALYRHHNLLKPWLGLPESWPAPLTMVKNLAGVPLHLFVHGEYNPAAWLGTAPVLDAFSLVAFAVGAYLYVRNVRLKRTPLFLSVAVVVAGLIAVGGTTINLTVIMPFVYLIIAGGATYLLKQWFKVFPRNPIARGIGQVLIYVLIGLACVYQLTHYFVAWPHAQATHEVFIVPDQKI